MTPRPGGDVIRTIDWQDGAIVLIDQTRLPSEFTTVRVTDIEALVVAIQRLVVRGAPALGGAGALGVALAARLFEHDRAARDAAIAEVRSSRPTAVNLAWGVDRVVAVLGAGPDAALAEARAVLDEDAAANRALGMRGADLVRELVGERAEGFRVMTHCNAGALACVEWGTALGVVHQLLDDGDLAHVTANETRPLLQGARLTAWELGEMGAPHQVIVDSAAASVIARGDIDVVIVGADRIAADGHVANKIGTYGLALAAARAGIPMIVAAPESTIDPGTASGADIHVEVRDPLEVGEFAGVRTTPAASPALNLAFDVTPPDLVTAIVTEQRVILPSQGQRASAAR